MARPNPRPGDASRIVEEARREALRDLSVYLDNRFTQEISAVKWDYPTPPKVRDIVDTGRLRASQTRIIEDDGSVTFSWPVEYATQVHEGGVSTMTRQPFPGRPWTEAPISEISQVFNKYFQDKLKKLDRL